MSSLRDLSGENTEEKESEDDEQEMSSQRGAHPKNRKKKKQWRKLPTVSKRFTITVTKNKWQTIAPLPGETKLRVKLIKLER